MSLISFYRQSFEQLSPLGFKRLKPQDIEIHQIHKKIAVGHEQLSLVRPASEWRLPQPNQPGDTMFIKAKMAVSAVFVLGAAFSAAAATRVHVTFAHRTATHNVVRGSNPQTHLDPDDPTLTGGGSLGYNQNVYKW